MIQRICALLIIPVLHTLFLSIHPPFNSVNIINITIILIFLLLGINKAIIPALIFGLIIDYNSMMIFLGTSSIIYLICLILVDITRNTVLTHQNLFSTFLLIALFNATFHASTLLTKLRFDMPVIQEFIFLTIVNTILSFSFFLVAKWVRTQFHKSFA